MKEYSNFKKSLKKALDDNKKFFKEITFKHILAYDIATFSIYSGIVFASTNDFGLSLPAFILGESGVFIAYGTGLHVNYKNLRSQD